jgi:broad specificity phosphatase PhoE
LKVSDTLLPADVADRLTTVIARPAAEAATRPAPVAGPVPSLIDHAQSLAGTAGQVATTHAVQALGGSTMTEIWERAGHSAKDLVESLLGEPWEETRTRAPQPAKTAEFLYHASKIVPGIADFLFTPAGAATAAVPGARPAVQAAIGAYYGTQMAKGTKESYDRFKADPSAATGGQLAGQVAGTLLPLVHAAGTEYRNQVRKAYIERAQTPDSFIEEKPNAEEKAGAAAPQQARPQPAAEPAGGIVTTGPQPGAAEPRPAAAGVQGVDHALPASDGGDHGAQPVAPDQRGGSVRGEPAPVPEGNGQQPVSGLPGAGGGGPAGGQPQPDAGREGANTRRVTGSANIPLNDAGRAQSRELAGRVAGKFSQVLSSPKDRSLETARMVDAGARTSDALGPWKLGDHEGKPADAERAAINDRVVNRPDSTPGVSAHSGEKGESFNQFRERVLGAVMQQMREAKPGERVLDVTHGRNLRLIDAWAKAGMQDDKSIDTAEMTKDGEWSKPGQLFRLTSGGLESVEKPERDGIYLARHGETDFQGKGGNENQAGVRGNDGAASGGAHPQVVQASEPVRPEVVQAQAPRPPATAPAYGRDVTVAVPGAGGQGPGEGAPAPPQGIRRLYRGQVGEYRPATDNSDNGRWFTPDPPTAGFYGGNQQLRYVDIPEADYQRLLAAEQEQSRLDPHSFAWKDAVRLPAELANQAARAPSPATPTIPAPSGSAAPAARTPATPPAYGRDVTVAGPGAGGQGPGDGARPSLFATERAPGVPRETGPHGPIYHEFYHDAQGALNHFEDHADGDAIGALYHPEVGDFDLTAAIARKLRDFHPEVLGDLQGFISGLKKLRESDNRIILASDDAQQRAVVRLDYDGVAKRWLLSAYDKQTGRSTGETTDAPGSPGLGEGTNAPPDRPTIPPSPEGNGGAPDSSLGRGGGEVNRRGPALGTAPAEGGPPKAVPIPKGGEGVYYGSGLGALEPLFREAKAEGDALRLKRNAALEAAKKAQGTPEERKAGERLRAWVTSELIEERALSA